MTSRTSAYLFFLLLCLMLLPRELAAGLGTDESALRQAVQGGDLSEVRQALEDGGDPNSRDEKGVPLLYVACRDKQPLIAQALVAAGADVNATSPACGHSSPLQMAIYSGFDSYELKPHEHYPELIRKLLEAGADVDWSDSVGDTPLIAAAEKDDVTTLNLLLERKVDLAHTNEKGWTALERAVQYRRRTIARKLYEAGAPLDSYQRKLQQHYHFARGAGGAFPAIVIGSFLLAALMHKRLKDLPKREATPDAGDDLPRLQPLKCESCGGSASLKPGAATCSHCHQPVPVPADYTETLKLRARTFKLMEKAVKLWKRVRIVSAWPVRLVLWLLAIGFIWYMWQGLFPLFVREAFYDLMSFRGTMVWALGVLAMAAISIALAGYAIYLHEVRATMPALPKRTKIGGWIVPDQPQTTVSPNMGRLLFIGVGTELPDVQDNFDPEGSFDGSPDLSLVTRLYPNSGGRMDFSFGDLARSHSGSQPEGTKIDGGEETLSCPNCAGQVEIGKEQIVGICGYCGSETYRVQLARKARAAAAQDTHAAATSLYTAMTRVYELRENAALAVPIAIMGIGMALVVVLRVLLFFI